MADVINKYLSEFYVILLVLSVFTDITLWL